MRVCARLMGWGRKISWGRRRGRFGAAVVRIQKFACLEGFGLGDFDGDSACGEGIAFIAEGGELLSDLGMETSRFES